jgi:hypothetical protein
MSGVQCEVAASDRNCSVHVGLPLFQSLSSARLIPEWLAPFRAPVIPSPTAHSRHRLGRSSRHLLTLPHGLGWSQPECRVVLSVCVPWEGLCEDVRSVLLGGNSLQGDGAEL